MPTSIRLLLLGALLLSLCSCGEKRRAQPAAVDGVLDLSNWDFEKDGIVDLKGEWRFVWEEFVDPMPSEKFREKYSGTIEVPSTWHTQPDPNQEGEYFPGQGYATYVLEVLLPPGAEGQELALASKHHNSSARYLMVEHESGTQRFLFVASSLRLVSTTHLNIIFKFPDNLTFLKLQGMYFVY